MLQPWSFEYDPTELSGEEAFPGLGGANTDCAIKGSTVTFLGANLSINIGLCSFAFAVEVLSAVISFPPEFTCSFQL